MDRGPDTAFEAIPEVFDPVHERPDVLEHAFDLFELGDDPFFGDGNRTSRRHHALLLEARAIRPKRSVSCSNSPASVLMVLRCRYGLLEVFSCL